MGGATRRPEAFLLLCYFDPAGISTVPENIAFLQSYSQFRVHVLNLFEHNAVAGPLTLSAAVDLTRFQGIIIHNTVSYNVDNLVSLDALTEVKLGRYAGVKVLFKQDENFRCRDLAAFVGEVRFDVVFTCLPPHERARVYPPAIVGPLRFEQMLTGYVTPTLRAMTAASGPRPIDIGYRGSIQPMHFGRLAYEKRSIGDDVARRLRGSRYRIDISSRWEDRFGGDAWLRFLATCKATLGVESGASIFDLDGSLAQRFEALDARYGARGEDEAAAQAYLAALADVEGNVDYAQVSPRHFEAAAAGTLQIMFPGRYSGIFTAGRHFFALERDFSNLSEALALIDDPVRRAQMTEAARAEIIDVPTWWIERFVERVDEILDALLREKACVLPVQRRGDKGARNVVLLASHAPWRDPRLAWIAQQAPEGLAVHRVGVRRVPDDADHVEPLPPHPLLRACERRPFDTAAFLALVGPDAMAAPGMADLLAWHAALALPTPAFHELFGAPLGHPRVDDFRWYLTHLLETSAALVAAVRPMRAVHAIIATDLDTLPAALILKRLLQVPLLYDAHEYWPEADVAQLDFERQFWSDLERRLVVHVDAAQTVSSGLAQLMCAEYGRSFAVVPNAEPAAAHVAPDAARAARRRMRTDGEVHFLYQGSFASGRGLEELLRIWPRTDPRAVLLLRGPSNAYRDALIEAARDAGLLGTRVRFPAAVAESALVEAASLADVGLIPYPARSANYAHCCPNKLSQYMAAALPVLANATTYVAHILRESGAGEILDFSREAELLDAIDRFTVEEGLRERHGAAGNRYFAECFNWNACSGSFYTTLATLTASAAPAMLEVHPVPEPRLYDARLGPSAGTRMSAPMPTEAEASGRESRLGARVNNGLLRIVERARDTGKRPSALRVVRRVWRLLPASLRQRMLGRIVRG